MQRTKQSINPFKTLDSEHKAIIPYFSFVHNSVNDFNVQIRNVRDMVIKHHKSQFLRQISKTRQLEDQNDQQPSKLNTTEWQQCLVGLTRQYPYVYNPESIKSIELQAVCRYSKLALDNIVPTHHQMDTHLFKLNFTKLIEHVYFGAQLTQTEKTIKAFEVIRDCVPVYGETSKKACKERQHKLKILTEISEQLNMEQMETHLLEQEKIILNQLLGKLPLHILHYTVAVSTLEEADVNEVEQTPMLAFRRKLSDEECAKMQNLEINSKFSRLSTQPQPIQFDLAVVQSY